MKMSTIVCNVNSLFIGVALAVNGINVVDQPIKFLSILVPTILFQAAAINYAAKGN